VAAAIGDGGRERVRIAVRDSGIGIAPHQHERIFERFARGDDAVNRRFGGTGLGLSISRSLAELAGGTLTVESTPGQGSTFVLEVPYQPAQAPETLAPLVPPSVLIISDDDNLVADLRTGLVRLDVEAISVCGTGAATGGQSVPNLDPVSIVMIDDRGAEGASLLGAVRRAKRLVDRGKGAAPVLVRIGAMPAVGADASAVPGDPTFVISLAWPPAGEALRDALHASARFASSIDLRAAAAGRVGPARLAARGEAVRVLVAEDNPVNRRVTARILERAGFLTHLVESGEDALDALAQDSFDAVLLDINMPGLSGLDVVKLYRMAALDQPHIPIIALSADATVETEQAALAAGVDVYLTKPVEASRLVAEIETLVAAGQDLAEPAAAAGRPAVAAGAEAHEGADDLTGDLEQASAAHLDAGGDDVVLNREAVAALDAFSGPDEDFATAILRDFIVNTDHLMADIREAAAAGDATGFRAAVHALRGTAGNVGADALRRFCQELQGMTKERLSANGEAYLTRLEWEFARLRREIGRYRAERRPASPA
jgi:two-component system sensor histidine kinase RpfC